MAGFQLNFDAAIEHYFMTYFVTVVWYVLLSVTTVMVVSAVSTLVTGLAMVSTTSLLVFAALLLDLCWNENFCPKATLFIVLHMHSAILFNVIHDCGWVVTTSCILLPVGVSHTFACLSAILLPVGMCHTFACWYMCHTFACLCAILLPVGMCHTFACLCAILLPVGMSHTFACWYVPYFCLLVCAILLPVVCVILLLLAYIARQPCSVV